MPFYLINMSPVDFLDGKITKEVWIDNPIDLDNLKVLGCQTYVHISNVDWSKLDQKYKKCAFDGYIKGMNEFKLWDPTWKKMLTNIYVVVDE